MLLINCCSIYSFLLFFSFAIAGRGGSLGGNLGISICNPKEWATMPTIPSCFDSRTQWVDCVSPIRDQGSCGGCWAFASTSVLTDRFCIVSNNTIKRLLSPQDLLSCSHTCQYPVLQTNCNNGCTGGYLDTAWKYFETTGTVGDSCLQFTDTSGICTQQCTNGSSYSSQQIFYSDSCYQLDSVSSMQAEIITNGPIESGFTVFEDFYDYNSGVYIYDGVSPVVGGHAVRILGWGEENNTTYWIVANSWGSSWGMNGYFYIRRGTDECGIEDNAIAGIPVTAGVHNYEEYPLQTDFSSSDESTTILVFMSLIAASVLVS